MQSCGLTCPPGGSRWGWRPDECASCRFLHSALPDPGLAAPARLTGAFRGGRWHRGWACEVRQAPGSALVRRCMGRHPAPDPVPARCSFSVQWRAASAGAGVRALLQLVALCTRACLLSSGSREPLCLLAGLRCAWVSGWRAARQKIMMQTKRVPQHNKRGRARAPAALRELRASGDYRLWHCAPPAACRCMWPCACPHAARPLPHAARGTPASWAASRHPAGGRCELHAPCPPSRGAGQTVK